MDSLETMITLEIMTKQEKSELKMAVRRKIKMLVLYHNHTTKDAESAVAKITFSQVLKRYFLVKILNIPIDKCDKIVV